MKKIVSFLLVICSLFILCYTTVFAVDGDDSFTLTMQIDHPVMTVNGIQKEIDTGRNTAPVMINNRTLVPIRAIVEEMGGTVNWEESTKTTTLTYENNEIRLTIDNTTAYFNKEVYTLDTTPITMNNRTMLPIRFIAEHFQFAVDWNQKEQTITITKAGQNGAPLPAPIVPPLPEESEETKEPRILVVYYSATGNTKTLAEKIAETTNSDLCEIVPEILYTSEDLNYSNDNCRANQEMVSDARPAIEALSVDLEEYDTIVLGYPIWWGQCPPPVQTFLDESDLSGKTIMPFCTSGSSGISGSLSKIRQLSPDSTVTDGFRGTSSTTKEQIDSWFEENGF